MTYEMNEFDTKKVIACNIQNISKSRNHILFYVYIFEKDTIIQKTNEVKKEIYGELEGHLSKDGKLFY